LHDADSPRLARDQFARPRPADPLLAAALLHVPLARRVQAEVELLAVSLPLQEELGLPISGLASGLQRRGLQPTLAGASCGHALAKQPAEKHHDGGGRGAGER
jgi:hypothetical protein